VLAYELYLKNRGSTANDVPWEKLVKKIFVNKGNIKIESKTLDEYRKGAVDNFRDLQEPLRSLSIRDSSSRPLA
jgi:hypothetical protein